jgi:hypothetical protein
LDVSISINTVPKRTPLRNAQSSIPNTRGCLIAGNDWFLWLSESAGNLHKTTKGTAMYRHALLFRGDKGRVFEPFGGGS